MQIAVVQGFLRGPFSTHNNNRGFGFEKCVMGFTRRDAILSAFLATLLLYGGHYSSLMWDFHKKESRISFKGHKLGFLLFERFSLCSRFILCQKFQNESPHDFNSINSSIGSTFQANIFIWFQNTETRMLMHFLMETFKHIEVNRLCNIINSSIGSTFQALGKCPIWFQNTATQIDGVSPEIFYFPMETFKHVELNRLCSHHSFQRSSSLQHGITNYTDYTVEKSGPARS